MTWLAGIVTAVLIGLIRDDVLYWLDRLCDALIRRSARRAPHGYSERLEEEWLAHAKQLPKLSRLVFALDCPRAVFRLSHQMCLAHVAVWKLASLRLLDVAAALFMLFATLPLLVLAAIALRIECGRHTPFLTRAPYFGQHGKRIYLLRINVSKNSKVAQFIRLTRMDELPLLLNILKGDMSLVGPRPYAEKQISDQSEYIKDRIRNQALRPGITGLSQLVLFAANRSAATMSVLLMLDFIFESKLGIRNVLRLLWWTTKVIAFGNTAAPTRAEILREVAGWPMHPGEVELMSDLIANIEREESEQLAFFLEQRRRTEDRQA